MRLTRNTTTLAAALVISASAVWATPAMAADEPEQRENGAAGIADALGRDLGLSPQEVKAQGALQKKALALDTKLQRSLGATYAGAYYDLDGGKLVVNVTDKAAKRAATAKGAKAVVVQHSLRELDGIKAALDKAAGIGDEAAGGGAVGGERTRAATRDIGVSAWSVDPVTNSVLISVTKEEAPAGKKLATRYGDAVTVELIDAAPQTAAYVDGGDGINGNSCSAGFNLRNNSTGVRYLLTAGHCVSGGQTVTGSNGTTFGTTLESWFPSFDDALIRTTNTSGWTQGPWVDTNPSNGGVVVTTGYTDALVGTVVCKSGITTKWTCGRITAKDQTVTYTGGRTVYGLTRHDACVEPGDSGGANVSVIGSYRAEGVTSGASLVNLNGQDRCIDALGLGWLGIKSVSWYNPVADSMAYYGAKYGVTTW